MAFVKRTTRPSSSDKWWKKPFNPCISVESSTSVLPNCFTGDTKIVTCDGSQRLDSLVNETLDILTYDGTFRRATIRNFGKQPIYEVVLESGNRYRCTANHRWLVWSANGDEKHFVETARLELGMLLKYVFTNNMYVAVEDVRPLGIIEDTYCPQEPITHTCVLGGGEITGQCVGYAWGRFAEIMNGTPQGLPTCNAGDWYAAVGNAYPKGSTPKLGAVLVLKKPGGAGHVAVVEEIYSDGSILLSNSAYGRYDKYYFYTCKQTPPNYYSSPYQFVGFIYNPAVSGDAVASIDLNSSEHPARKFVAELESHVGYQGHTWVQQNTSIGGGAWCAATMCAGAKAVGIADIVMPSAQYAAATFGRMTAEQYGGTFYPGPKQGSTFDPQIGDLICFEGSRGGTYERGTKYSASHIGAVRGVEGSSILTVEGNVRSQIVLASYPKTSTYISYFVRPDWSKVGGDGSPLTTVIGGGELYTTRSTKADASLREIGYFDNGQKTLVKSGCRLSVLNYTSNLADLVRLAGGIQQEVSASGSADNIDGLPAVQREIVQFLVSKGLNTAAAVGILGNIEAESNFNTAAVGDYGTSFGICQWHLDRGSKMKSMAGSNWSTNLTGQLNYLWHELSTSYKSSVLDPLKQVPNTLEGAKQAADIFVRKFEVPANVDTQSKIRQANAEKWWSKVVVNPGGGGTSAASGKIVTQSGKQITTGESIAVPSSVAQTGIIANYTSYTGFYGRWSKGTNQRKLSEIWGSQGKPNMNYVASISGYYLIALSPKFGKCGDMVTVHLEDNSYFNAIIGDEKGRDAQSPWGHVLSGSAVDIVEWEAAGSSQSSLRDGLRQAGFLGKKVSRIVNYGTYFQ